MKTMNDLALSLLMTVLEWAVEMDFIEEIGTSDLQELRELAWRVWERLDEEADRRYDEESE